VEDGAQNVMFPLRQARGCRRPKRDVALHFLDKVGLAAFADAYPHTLSGGMKQRVAIARAGDAAEGAADGRAVRRARRDAPAHAGRTAALWDDAAFTLLFVTHSIEEALVVGNRILLLSPHPGRVRAELNSHQFTLASQGSAEFQAAAQRIHRCCSTPPVADVSRIAHACPHIHDRLRCRQSPVRPEYEHVLAVHGRAVVAPLPWYRQLWQQGWLRKAVILLVLAALWEIVARIRTTTCCCRPSGHGVRSAKASPAANCWARRRCRCRCCCRAMRPASCWRSC
jgi:hypothetical protein